MGAIPQFVQNFGSLSLKEQQAVAQNGQYLDELSRVIQDTTRIWDHLRFQVGVDQFDVFHPEVIQHIKNQGLFVRFTQEAGKLQPTVTYERQEEKLQGFWGKYRSWRGQETSSSCKILQALMANRVAIAKEMVETPLNFDNKNDQDQRLARIVTIKKELGNYLIAIQSNAILQKDAWDGFGPWEKVVAKVISFFHSFVASPFSSEKCLQNLPQIPPEVLACLDLPGHPEPPDDKIARLNQVEGRILRYLHHYGLSFGPILDDFPLPAHFDDLIPAREFYWNHLSSPEAKKAVSRMRYADWKLREVRKHFSLEAAIECKYQAIQALLEGIRAFRDAYQDLQRRPDNRDALLKIATANFFLYIGSKEDLYNIRIVFDAFKIGLPIYHPFPLQKKLGEELLFEASHIASGILDELFSRNIGLCKEALRKMENLAERGPNQLSPEVKQEIRQMIEKCRRHIEHLEENKRLELLL